MPLDPGDANYVARTDDRLSTYLPEVGNTQGSAELVAIFVGNNNVLVSGAMGLS